MFHPSDQKRDGKRGSWPQKICVCSSRLVCQSKKSPKKIFEETKEIYGQGSHKDVGKDRDAKVEKEEVICEEKEN